MSKKIAIVGAGISGMGTAWMLKESGFDVTVFEPRPIAGGQMEWFDITCSNGEKVRFDMYVVCLAESHNMRALGAHWNLPIIEFDFGVYYENGPYSWGNYRHTDFWVSQQEECKRFVRLLKDLYEENASIEASAVSIKDFLSNHGFSDDFGTHILCPLLATLLDVPKEELDHFSLGVFTELLGNQLLSALELPRMYRFRNGVSDIVMALSGALEGHIHFNTGVQKITRSNGQVALLDANGSLHYFDEVVMSCDFQHCLHLIDDLSAAEKTILNGIRYNKIRVLINEDPFVWEAPDAEDERLVTMHKENLVTIPSLKYGHDFFKQPQLYASSVIGERPSGIDPQKILLERNYHLELLNSESMYTKSCVRYIQGGSHVWYCGLSTVPGLSECCLASGFVIAEKLGATYPFEQNEQAKMVFENVKNFMFGHSPSLRLIR